MFESVGHYSTKTKQITWHNPMEVGNPTNHVIDNGRGQVQLYRPHPHYGFLIIDKTAEYADHLDNCMVYLDALADEAERRNSKAAGASMGVL